MVLLKCPRSFTEIHHLLVTNKIPIIKEEQRGGLVPPDTMRPPKASIITAVVLVVRLANGKMQA